MGIYEKTLPTGLEPTQRTFAVNTTAYCRRVPDLCRCLWQQHRAVQSQGRSDRLGWAGACDRIALPGGDGGKRAASECSEAAGRFLFVQRRAADWEGDWKDAWKIGCRATLPQPNKGAEVVPRACCRCRSVR